MVEWAFEDSITEPARWQYLAEWGKVHQKALASLFFCVYFISSFYLFIFFISWRLITLQYCSG